MMPTCLELGLVLFVQSEEMHYMHICTWCVETVRMGMDLSNWSSVYTPEHREQCQVTISPIEISVM